MMNELVIAAGRSRSAVTESRSESKPIRCKPVVMLKQAFEKIGAVKVRLKDESSKSWWRLSSRLAPTVDVTHSITRVSEQGEDTKLR